MANLEGISGEAAWLDGKFVRRRELALPLGDAGFVLGATVTEQLRTVRGELFLPEPHARRLAESLQAVGIRAFEPPDSLLTAAARLAAHNHRCLPQRGSLPPDLGVVIFVTAGDQASQHEGRSGSPRTVIHSFPLAFGMWARAYDAGVSLRSVSVRQVPPDCWPLSAKVRSRLHYFLADREAAAAEPGSRAVLAHLDGRISETSTANLAIVRQGRITSPPPADALSGVSLAFTRELAGELGLPWTEESLSAADLATADEILLTSTPNCLLPATRFDGRLIGSGEPGPVYRQLLAAWSEAVGLDIAAQAQAHAG
ncbi:MAG: D-alanine aminotransferase [Planctomycetota bacterium]|jgi:branched-subunit amino acid aminotransferase/4-amino-4-deoxychorismate lyase